MNASQALADVAAFITAMNEEFEFPDETKWIVFGGYYGGSLAAWMRLKYPKLVHGAVASSAPIVAKLDIPGTYLTYILSCNAQDLFFGIHQIEIGIDF